MHLLSFFGNTPVILADSALEDWRVVLDVFGIFGALIVLTVIIFALMMIPDFFRYMRIRSL